MHAPPTTLTDQRGAVYRLGACLGRGAQGAVYATEVPGRVIKLLDASSHAERAALTARFGFVRRLGLSEHHVARPLELLTPPALGYVMELLDDMAPLRTLLPSRSLAVPVLDWYADGGGLRRRLRLLAHIGEALVGLHARGLAFADPSPSNAFISSDIAHEEAWLIDSDNITVGGTGPAIYTPPYGAPEVVRGESAPSTLADAHAFAVMVFEALALIHPLIGDVVADGEPEIEDAALEGRWPWVDHPDDDRNRSSLGIPRAVVLSPRLHSLAALAFGAGLDDRFVRPSVSAWVDALHSAADATVQCRQCPHTFYVTAAECPWCDAALPPIALGQIANIVWTDPPSTDDARGPVDAVGPAREPVPRPIRRGLVVVGHEGFTLRRRHIDGTVGVAGRAPIAALRAVSRGLEITASSHHPLVAAEPEKPDIELGALPRTLPLDRDTRWALRLRVLGETPRIWRAIGFEARSAARR